MAGIKMAKELLSKTPEEVVFRDMDFSQDGLAASETITAIPTVTITRTDGQPVIPGTDLTKDSQTFSGQKVQFYFSKGVVNITYEVHVTVTTSLNQTKTGCGKIKIGPC